MKCQSTLRTLPRFLLLFALLSAVPAAFCLSLGDHLPAVYQELGQPVGEVEIQGMTLLVYPRGEIRAREGRVTAINLISEAELEARLVAEREVRERIKVERVARMERIEAEGLEIRASKTTDPAFLRLPAFAQLQFWRSFASRYPMVSINAEIEALHERVELEKQIQELEHSSEDRLAQLEARVAAAESRSREAESQANAWRYYGTSYPSSYYWRPPIVVRRDRCPPRVPRKPETIPYADRPSEARARAMADIEASRRAHYSGRN